MEGQIAFSNPPGIQASETIWVFTILQHTLIDLSGGQIECDEPLVLGMDHPSKELIPIVQVPPHKGKHLCEEDLAGDLLGLAPAGTGSAPGAGISVLCPARADRQNLTLLVDQHLYLIHLGKTVQQAAFT